MEKEIKMRFDVGDPNYTRPGEYYMELTEDSSEMKAIYHRDDDLTLRKVVSADGPAPTSDFRIIKSTADYSTIGEDFQTESKAEAVAKLGITEEEFDYMFSEEHNDVLILLVGYSYEGGYVYNYPLMMNLLKYPDEDIVEDTEGNLIIRYIHGYETYYQIGCYL